MESTWSRDLSVLETVVRLCDENEWGSVEPHEIAAHVTMETDTVKRALWKLAKEQPPLFEYSDLSSFGGRDLGNIRNPTGHAQRTVDAWPTPDNLAERIVWALNEAADKESDPDERSKLRHAADVSKAALAGVLTEVLTQGL